MPKLVYPTLILAFSLTACGNEPWTVSRSPDEVTMRWWSTDRTADVSAENDASAYCARLGKGAEFGSLERAGSAVIARYHCV